MEQIQTLIANAAKDLDVRFRSYSGRAMYGKQCVAITGTMQDVGSVIGTVIKMAADEVIVMATDATSDEEMDKVGEESSNLDKLIDALMDFRTDSMGYDIVAYWPDIEPLQEEDEECSVDEEG